MADTETARENEEDDVPFQPVLSRGDKQNIKRTKMVSTYGSPTLEWMSEQYNNYFKAMYGKQLDFRITLHSQPYMTPMENRRQLDSVLQTQFWCRPKIWDLMCGSGADGLCALMHLRPEHLTLVDSNNKEGWDTLLHNIQEAPRLYPRHFKTPDNLFQTYKDLEDDRTQISAHNLSAISFIKRYARDHQLYIATPEKKHAPEPHIIHLVYLDPPWGRQAMEHLIKESAIMGDAAENAYITSAKEKREANGGKSDPNSDHIIEHEVNFSTMIRYVESILQTMAAYNIECSVLCFKNRFHVTRQTFAENTKGKKVGKDFSVLYSVEATPWMDLYRTEDFQNAPPETDPYHAQKGLFHWAVLRHKYWEHMRDGRHNWYVRSLTNRLFEERPGHYWVETASQIKEPFEPEYGKQMKYPTITWTRPAANTSDQYMMITRTTCPPQEKKMIWNLKHHPNSNPNAVFRHEDQKRKKALYREEDQKNMSGNKNRKVRSSLLELLQQLQLTND